MVVHGNRLEDLRALAVEWMRRHPPAPLENETILVQSNGIAQWLKLALAMDPEGPESGLGIAAALDVQLPARFLWNAYRAVLGPEAVPTESPFAKDPLTWRLMRLLPECLEQTAFAPLRRFLTDDADLRKRHQLALRLADLLDQYQVYRADWLVDWAEGRDQVRDPRGVLRPLDTEESRWQPALWRALIGDMPPDARSLSRAGVHARFMERVRSQEAGPPGLPRRVIVFGISSLPAQTLEALEGLARFSQVLLCVHNPCRHYWADIISDKDLLRARRRRQSPKAGMPEVIAEEDLHNHAHPLLAAWGKQGRDYIRLLDEHDDPSHYRRLLESLPWQRIDLFEPQGGRTLLQQLQDDILDLRPLNETRDHWPLVDSARDDSIRFHVAHSPQREVEILHDQLLARFSRDPDLRPRDVIIMVPDVDRYAPHVQAVFGQTRPEDPRHIPFCFSDQARRGRDPLLVVLEQLLRLPESRLSVSELLDLLDLPALRNRFDIDPGDLPRLRAWIEGAGIRWGMDARQRAALSLPPGLEQNTWRFGLRRMLLGYAVGNPGPWQDIEPYDEISGLDAALIGPLHTLLEALDQTWQGLSEPATPAGWGARLRTLVQTFFAPVDEREQLMLRRMDEALEHWEALCQAAGMAECLPLTVVREHWLSALDESHLSQRFLSGAVTLCTLMPMRAIPYRVVCLLGMNDGDYPRRHTPMDFDLMAGEHRPGDRSRREDDRYLFLEALLSARAHLYISWVGRGIRDNAPLPPSVLVSQLRDHLAAGWRPQGGGDGEDLLQALTTAYPLQPFGRAYFQGDDDRLFTYAREWEALYAISTGADSAREQRHPHGQEALSPPVPEEALTAEDLAAFLKDPVRSFFQRRLKVHLDAAPAAGEDQEPFTLDGLDRWQALDHLLGAALADNEDPEQSTERLEAALTGWQRSGRLPLGEIGRQQGAALRAEAMNLVMAWQEAVRTCPRRLPRAELLRFEHDGWVVEGWLPRLRLDEAGERVHLHYRTGTLRAKINPFKRLDKACLAWVQHLMAHAQGLSLRTMLVGLDDTLCMDPLPTAEARDHLRTLLQAWATGMTRPLPAYCRGSSAWLDALDRDGKDPEDVLTQVHAGDGFRGGAVDQDPWLARAWPDTRSLLAQPDFAAWARDLYGPLSRAAYLLDKD
ncbi:exodeoxyribonuclease V subunit gamma [Ectothiorhodospira lacustris]|uniref:exodeoxyribonuclease V subunit gamma n=1 Tax=Ectothiorhodospira lacustris TaxID=2899127 RepID=UPI001EE9A302|nr:exodeoxyribonuclease V subunit gamma [Ectothiorhodospira lacustris]MCG5500084.1 exodeoxyribonuclease V subunit gamma [Ectothiorhodospira lacustris]MCG5509438.1 exodeoxyribonuclease V subunit gamma [Ectothiorhodospira lacustris]MCG5521492.1 exodeoxyribonuclease V subunit gamma [Ectothiorhodospira lacustris]